MHLLAATVTVLLIAGGIVPAMGEEVGIDNRVRSAINFAAGQAVEDPRVHALETVSEIVVEQACGKGTGAGCQEAQQTSLVIGVTLPVVLAAAFVATLLPRGG